MIAITREISPSIVRCELTHVARAPIDVELARRQHEEYERCLASAGCTIRRLPSDAAMPDSVFVEDVAVVFDELALVTRRRVFIGRSSRTNDAGIAQARSILEPFGYQVAGIDLTGCLHLKSAVTAIDDCRLVVNADWVAVDVFEGFELVAVDASEPFAANVLRIGERLICAEAHPRTARRLERCGFAVSTVDMSETAKAEGGVTCCSLVLRD